MRALEWRDPAAAQIALPGGVLRLRWSAGSGLTYGASGLWGLGDRGPNLPVALARERYGVAGLDHLAGVAGAKIMSNPEIGPELTQLRIEGGRVHAGARLRLTTPAGRPLPGLPPPGHDVSAMEPVFDLAGAPLANDLDGADTEAVAVAPDGGFWVADEYAPSILRVDAAGIVRRRFVPAGLALKGAEIDVRQTLPAIALRRRMNRGFEALAVSADGRRLYAMFQSGLRGDGAPARHTRIWTIDADTGAVIAQHLYPFDPPAAFRRDGGASAADLKVCEVVCVGENRLLVLERVTRSAKIYAVTLGEPLPQVLLTAAGPMLEDMDDEALSRADVRPLAKTLLLDTDDAEEISADLEGMAATGSSTLILATDNDFGIEGAQTRFFEVRFERPLTD